MEPLFKKHTIILGILCFCALGILSAQTASEIEVLLGTSEVTYGQAASFVLRASEAVKTSNVREAFNLAVERKWLPKNASPDSKARLDGISLLVMQSFGLKGGLLYSLFKNPHYSYRELAARGAFKGKSDPHNAVSGDQLLFITNRVLSIIEGERQ
ncbi:MAG: hypothetical protein LBB72_07210 [Spirochaetaceae bacterium]|nr:hypothetical protein [Spirochaetaceae bacterium]